MSRGAGTDLSRGKSLVTGVPGIKYPDGKSLYNFECFREIGVDSVIKVLGPEGPQYNGRVLKRRLSYYGPFRSFNYLIETAVMRTLSA